MSYFSWSNHASYGASSSINPMPSHPAMTQTWPIGGTSRLPSWGPPSDKQQHDSTTPAVSGSRSGHQSKGLQSPYPVGVLINRATQPLPSHGPRRNSLGYTTLAFPGFLDGKGSKRLQNPCHLGVARAGRSPTDCKNPTEVPSQWKNQKGPITPAISESLEWRRPCRDCFPRTAH